MLRLDPAKLGAGRFHRSRRGSQPNWPSLATDGEQVEHRHRNTAVEVQSLRNVPDPRASFPATPVGVEKANRSGIGDEAQDRAKKCRLARSIGTDDSRHGATRDFGADRREDFDPSRPDGEVVDLDGRGSRNWSQDSEPRIRSKPTPPVEMATVDRRYTRSRERGRDSFRFAPVCAPTWRGRRKSLTGIAGRSCSNRLFVPTESARWAQF